MNFLKSIIGTSNDGENNAAHEDNRDNRSRSTNSFGPFKVEMEETHDGKKCAVYVLQFVCFINFPKL